MAPGLLRSSLFALNGSRKFLVTTTSLANNAKRLLSTRTSASQISSVDGNKTPSGFDDVKEAEVLSGLKQLFQDEVRDHSVVPVFKKALLYGEKVAIKDQISEFSFSRIYAGAKKFSILISNLCGSASMSRVAFLCPNDVSYVLTQWACWFSGQIAVPLSSRHPPELLEYFIADSDAKVLVTTSDFLSVMEPLSKKLNLTLLVIDNLDKYIPTADEQQQNGSYLDPKNENVLNFNNQLIVEGALNGKFYSDASAMILYTSGTTGRPKGAVITHKALNTHVDSLTNAWMFDSADAVLHCLPLHHVHGIVNALVTPLSVGARCTMLPHYDSNVVWTHLLNVNKPGKDRVNVFMAVPTIYSLLMKEYDKIFSSNSQMTEYIKSHCKSKIRLMLSGSAPLPATIMKRWLEITGHNLLERYGMTETGMVLSNPYIQDKTRARKPTFVGHPLPHYEVRITKPDEPASVLFEMRGQLDKGYWNPATDLPVFEAKPTDAASKITGDLYVRGPGLFKEYWRKPEDTAKEFEDGWFKTGDSASFEEGAFKILGRTSVDIIKTGGFKVSALEVETQLLSHPNVADCAVIGVPDETWGQHIGAVVVSKDGAEITLEDMKTWATDRMASYAVPHIVKCIKAMPRNAMGKVDKKTLLGKVFTEAPKVE